MAGETLSKTAEGSTLRYSNVAIALHWAIAALIAYNLASGLLRPVLPRGFFVFHVSSGITILLLSPIRVAWRLTHRPPPLLPMSRREVLLAHSVHGALYAAMLLLPLSGWVLVSAKPPTGSPGATWSFRHPKEVPAGASTDGPVRRPPTMFWGIVRLPLMTPVSEIGRSPTGVLGQRQLREKVEIAHRLGAWVLLVLLALHIGGALKHQLLDRQAELRRMKMT